MNKNRSATNQAELTPLRELCARIGGDPLLTQASTGNSSIKLEGALWMKASGEWMANAIREDILIPLDLAEVKERVKHKVDPAERYTRASIETAMHAVLPHRVVLHVHCVNTIAWAVRQDAPVQLEHQLDGLRWQWISYVPSGLPLAWEIERFYPSPQTPTSSYWATTVWSSAEMIAALSKISYPRYSNVWPFVRDRQARPTTLR